MTITLAGVMEKYTEIVTQDYVISQVGGTNRTILHLDMNQSAGRLIDETDCSSDKLIFRIYQVFVPTLFAGIILCGLLGNGLVIYVILSRKNLQTVTNLLLLNLALSDVAFLLICGSFSVAHYVLTEWPLGLALCRLIQYFQYVSCYVTVYTLVAVSVVRYISVVHGPHTRFVSRKKNIIILIIVMWLVLLVAKIPILLVHEVAENPTTRRIECIISAKVYGQNLFATFFAFAYALPLVVMGTLYVMISHHLRSRSAQPTSPGHQEDRHNHVTKVGTVLVCTFAICWLPLHIHLLTAYYASIPDSVAYKVLLIVWHCLIYVNSMLNPLIYNCFSTDFRQSFRDVVRCAKQPPAPVEV